MGLDLSGYEKQQAQGSTASQPDKFDLFSSTLSPSDPNQEGKFKYGFQASWFTLTSSSSDELAPAAAAAHLLCPGVSLARRPHHAPRHPQTLPETLSTADEALDALAFIPMSASHRQYLDELVRRMIQLDHFDGTPMAHSARDQWLQDGVAPAAVQPDVLETKPSTSVAVSSPSSTSSSSKASSTRKQTYFIKNMWSQLGAVNEAGPEDDPSAAKKPVGGSCALF
ncbi:hypothetical protein PtB15_12B527 [Puccinia triticina]|nr:hypothetical protein PtB15_12B527 [Puccinia triticina]